MIIVQFRHPKRKTLRIELPKRKITKCNTLKKKFLDVLSDIKNRSLPPRNDLL